MTESSDYIIKNICATLEEEIEGSAQVVDYIIGAKKVFIYGVGRSGLIAKSFAIRLVQMGLEVFFVGETITPIVEEGNVVVIVSYTGETMSAIQVANIVRRGGAKVVTITANDHSKLASASNLVVILKPPKDDDRKRLAPLGTIFEGAALIYLDSLVAVMMEKLGQIEGSMRKRHALWI